MIPLESRPKIQLWSHPLQSALFGMVIMLYVVYCYSLASLLLIDSLTDSGSP